MTEGQLGWIAGIIEGEGWIGVTSNQRSARIQVNSNDEDVIDRLREITGLGQVYKNRIRKAGNPYHTWSVSTRRDVRFLLRAIRPYMLARRAAAIEKALSQIA